MKKAIILLVNTLLLSAFDTSNAQNLVPNPGFENYFSCPVGTAELYRCKDWTSYGDSPDYFHACSPDSAVCIPKNNFGFQYAASGFAYAGFINESSPPSPPREYLGATLTLPLSIGQTYYASFKVSFSGFGCPSNKMGIRFSTIPYDSSAIQSINNVAMVYTDSVLSDTLIWYQVKGSFIADSNYAYIIVGNYFNNGSSCPALTFSSYYFLDDVCVSTDSLTCYTSVGIEEPKSDFAVNLFPNPFFDELNILTGSSEKLEITLYDVTSRKILSKQFTGNLTLSTKYFESGVYMYEIRNDRGVLRQGKVIKY